MSQSNQVSVNSIKEESFYDDDPRAPRTPWGKAQHVTSYCEGLQEVVCAGHGGWRVANPELRKMIPTVFRKTWYEEDCEAYIVLFYLYDVLKPLAVEMEQTGNKFPFAGSLRSLLTYSKEEFGEHIKYWFRAEWDMVNGVESEREDFGSERDYLRYLQRREQLASKRKAPTVKDGDVILFKEPFRFNVGGRKWELSEFKVVKQGRAVKFKSTDDKFPWLAHLTKWRERQYEIVKQN